MVFNLLFSLIFAISNSCLKAENTLVKEDIQGSLIALVKEDTLAKQDSLIVRLLNKEYKLLKNFFSASQKIVARQGFSPEEMQDLQESGKQAAFLVILGTGGMTIYGRQAIYRWLQSLYSKGYTMAKEIAQGKAPESKNPDKQKAPIAGDSPEKIEQTVFGVPAKESQTASTGKVDALKKRFTVSNEESEVTKAFPPVQNPDKDKEVQRKSSLSVSPQPDEKKSTTGSERKKELTEEERREAKRIKEQERNRAKKERRLKRKNDEALALKQETDTVKKESTVSEEESGIELSEEQKAANSKKFQKVMKRTREIAAKNRQEVPGAASEVEPEKVLTKRALPAVPISSEQKNNEVPIKNSAKTAPASVLTKILAQNSSAQLSVSPDTKSKELKKEQTKQIESSLVSEQKEKKQPVAAASVPSSEPESAKAIATLPAEQKEEERKVEKPKMNPLLLASIQSPGVVLKRAEDRKLAPKPDDDTGNGSFLDATKKSKEVNEAVERARKKQEEQEERLNKRMSEYNSDWSTMTPAQRKKILAEFAKEEEKAKEEAQEETKEDNASQIEVRPSTPIEDKKPIENRQGLKAAAVLDETESLKALLKGRRKGVQGDDSNSTVGRAKGKRLGLGPTIDEINAKYQADQKKIAALQSNPALAAPENPPNEKEDESSSSDEE